MQNDKKFWIIHIYHIVTKTKMEVSKRHGNNMEKTYFFDDFLRLETFMKKERMEPET